LVVRENSCPARLTRQTKMSGQSDCAGKIRKAHLKRAVAATVCLLALVSSIIEIANLLFIYWHKSSAADLGKWKLGLEAQLINGVKAKPDYRRNL
jgi:hypothetical protein